jgi:S1-C subfamily serine protease
MKTSTFPLSNLCRCLAGAALLAIVCGVSCGPPAWRGGIHALLAWSPTGVRVVEVPQDSPAERAGLRPDDRLLTIDGRPTSGMTSEQVQHRLSGEVGSVVALEVLRGDQELALNITREPYARAGDKPVPQRGY